jgi:hypothetical protein
MPHRRMCAIIPLPYPAKVYSKCVAMIRDADGGEAATGRALDAGWKGAGQLEIEK